MTAVSPAPALGPLPALPLPRARGLTDALTSAASRALADGRDVAGTRAYLAEELSRRLSQRLRRRGDDRARDCGRTACVRIGAYELSAEAGAARRGPPARFRWTARGARRPVGLAAVRLLVEGRAGSPVEAVRSVVADPVAAGCVGGAGRGSCTDWIGTLPRPARALVEAEASTWATRLWTALEWDRLAPAPVVGEPDRWWDVAGPTRIALRGRSDVRVVTGDGGSCLLSVRPGAPGPSARVELGLAALVEALGGSPARAPAAVAGWWPDCGRAWVLAADGRLLADTARAVVEAVTEAVPQAVAADAEQVAATLPATVRAA